MNKQIVNLTNDLIARLHLRALYSATGANFPAGAEAIIRECCVIKKMTPAKVGEIISYFMSNDPEIESWADDMEARDFQELFTSDGKATLRNILASLLTSVIYNQLDTEPDDK